ncbi:selenide, water dikinase SelD [Aliikangiella sp. G2MR2-5]|uniref:selenide, water dikinase SelD n=1 Tax=Aliikangiella sp. G2MR2-5 TaxID=2788943 RepID=UPI0018AA7FD1|nr:selenide, water dikinase SelD [Aliikangiella sp. G2MR2-5]
MNEQVVKLTEFSHGAGCGCKISPKVLSTILQSSLPVMEDERLLVGNTTRDDAAVYQLDDSTAVISTTDFFMPIVDDPFTFGRIAATNAISDIYAMGGTPIMAIAILGWPLDKLSPDVAQQVVEGGRKACMDAGIMLAGGHSIDAPEPIFGLAVTGRVSLTDLKQNNTARQGDKLYLTKPLGIGVLTTAQKKKKLLPEDSNIAVNAMCQLNTFGAQLVGISGVNAMTDVTGFGLAGHLLEMCQGAELSAAIEFQCIPRLNRVDHYLALDCVPGGTGRNYDSYGEHLPSLTASQIQLLCDPQTSGGLLISVSAQAEQALVDRAKENNQEIYLIGEMKDKSEQWIELV